MTRRPRQELRSLRQSNIFWPVNKEVTSNAYNPRHQLILLGTKVGHFEAAIKCITFTSLYLITKLAKCV